jgi:LacI family transcriptional regulator
MSEITIKTIAQEAGVSISLVSQVLNGRNVRVAQKTRERIHAVADKYHYVPNSIASCLKLKQTHTIALVAPFTPYGFFSNLIYHVQRYAQEAGYLTMVLNTFEDEKQESKEMALFRTGMFDGMLLAPLSSAGGNEVIEQMVEAEYPFVCVDRFKSPHAVPIISSDHEKVGYEMTERELAKGKRNIIFLYRENSHNTSGEFRLEGYLRAMKEAGVQPRTYRFRYCQRHDEDLQEMLWTIRSIRHKPEAVFIHSGYYLPLFIEACQKCGVDLGAMDYMMVDGFHFTEQAMDISKVFGVISGRCSIAVQNVEQIAKTAVEKLVSLIAGERETGDLITIPPKYRVF